MEQSLPSFRNPPLDEVVLGVQFEAPSNYTSVDAASVWEIFKDDFPTVVEMPRLEPQFETFGGAVAGAGFQLNFGPGSPKSRLWFVSKDQTHLVQFQDDRFLINWRKRPNGVDSSQPYPRFEPIVSSFKAYLERLSEFYLSHFGINLAVNQAEVSYINLIKHDVLPVGMQVFSFLDLSAFKLEGVNSFFTEAVNDGLGRPIARLSHDLQSMFTRDGGSGAYGLSLTYRGRPSGPTVDSAVEFLEAGRKMIVFRFCDLTTSQAQEAWGRMRNE